MNKVYTQQRGILTRYINIENILCGPDTVQSTTEFMLSQISITGLYHFYGTLSTIQTIHLIQIKGVPKLLDLWIKSRNNETDD